MYSTGDVKWVKVNQSQRSSLPDLRCNFSCNDLCAVLDFGVFKKIFSGKSNLFKVCRSFLCEENGKIKIYLRIL